MTRTSSWQASNNAVSSCREHLASALVAPAGLTRPALIAAGALPPTVADTKRKFMEAYRYPIPSVYGTVLQELLVTQHLTRFNSNYAYSPVRVLACRLVDATSTRALVLVLSCGFTGTACGSQDCGGVPTLKTTPHSFRWPPSASAASSTSSWRASPSQTPRTASSRACTPPGCALKWKHRRAPGLTTLSHNRAFLKSLDENPDQWRKDQAAMTAAAQSGGGVAALAGMDQLAALKQRAASNTLVYSKFIAIGLFRMLELAGVMEPQALQSLSDAAGVPLSKVNADLNLYKGLLSKLSAAKELMAELLERDRKKTAERLAAKAAQAASPA